MALKFPGDPTPLGWLTLAGYILAAWHCLRAARAHPDHHRSLFWTGLMALLLLLGVNKQLDLQTMIVAAGRQLSKAQGWYEYRHAIQVFFVSLLLLAAIGFVTIFAWLSRHDWRDHATALFGLALLAGYIILRAADVDKVDEFAGLPLRMLRAKWVLELGGIVCIGISAWRHASPRSRLPETHPQSQ